VSLDAAPLDAVPMDADDPLAACLAGHAAGDEAARDRIIELCADRLQTLAHRMLARFPQVRRWQDTDDVFQNAALRLHRTLGMLRPASPADLLALATTHIERELIDLARRHAGPYSYARNHGTNMAPAADGGDATFIVDGQVSAAAESAEAVDRWTRFHEAIESLPPEQREVFRLAWYLGADQKTIAHAVGCSERTVKTRWRAAREAIQAALGEPPDTA
jgi:RNA polymerase sigma factor (sigma-70 family)